ncbi:MAG: His/Gly/Thr/Pro-type tRNA ligase C-terminal domain-containing protein, partial [Ferruginibacter sp.]
GTQVLFFNLGETESAFAFQCMQQLRAQHIACELYHENAKMGKQFNYAEKKNIPFAIIIGQQEISENACVIKNLATQEQQKLTVGQLLQYFNK